MPIPPASSLFHATPSAVMPSRSVILLVLCSALVLGGCNVFETFYEEGTSSSAEVLLQDARAALERGDAEKAKAYLQRAHENDPSNAEVRVELSAVELQANDITVLGIKALADHIQDAAADGGQRSLTPDAPLVAAGTHTFNNTVRVCNFDEARYPEARVFEYTALEAFERIQQREAVLARVHELLREIDGESLARRQHARLLLMDAIVRIARTVLTLQDAADRAGVTLYRLSDDGIGVCANADEVLRAFEGVLKCELVADLSRARGSLQARLELLDNPRGSASAEILSVLDEAIARLNEQVDLDCA